MLFHAAKLPLRVFSILFKVQWAHFKQFTEFTCLSMKFYNCDHTNKGNYTTTSTIAALNESSSRAAKTPAKPSTYAPIPNSTHLDAVPQATPINRLVWKLFFKLSSKSIQCITVSVFISFQKNDSKKIAPSFSIEVTKVSFILKTLKIWRASLNLTHLVGKRSTLYARTQFSGHIGYTYLIEGYKNCMTPF